ncbi:polyubiquitin-like [Thunnus albacares]|uniref:polyubiquitin-like n=1 Tax=Thunnus albacares TaxID=8236 RepID=UPI001CF65BCD|nr:polyubiquitin-like [Thunnus albacares]
MSKIYQVVVHGLMGQKKEIDLCDSEEQLQRMTVLQLKEKIAESFPEYADEFGRLTVGLHLRENVRDSTLLSECGIQHMSDLQLERTVLVKNSNGKMIKINYDEGTTVDNLRAKMQYKEGFPADQQRLIYGGKELQHGRLSDYGIQHMDTIDLTLSLRGGWLPPEEGKGWVIPDTVDGAMGDKEGRNQSTENFSNFKTPSGSNCAIL